MPCLHGVSNIALHHATAHCRPHLHGISLTGSRAPWLKPAKACLMPFYKTLAYIKDIEFLQGFGAHFIESWTELSDSALY